MGTRGSFWPAFLPLTTTLCFGTTTLAQNAKTNYVKAEPTSTPDECPDSADSDSFVMMSSSARLNQSLSDRLVTGLRVTEADKDRPLYVYLESRNRKATIPAEKKIKQLPESEVRVLGLPEINYWVFGQNGTAGCLTCFVSIKSN